MNKILRVILLIIFLPFIFIYHLYLRCEKIIVKHSSYFKQNKLTIKDNYYYGILTDPIFKIQNIIAKYNLKYRVISSDENRIHYVINDDNECRLIIIDLKNIYSKEGKIYIQFNMDEVKIAQLDQYLTSVKIKSYDYHNSKLLVLKEDISDKDDEELLSNSQIIVIKKVNKTILQFLD